MKFGRPLTMIVHYNVQSILECCISSVPDRGPSTIFENYIKSSKDILKQKVITFQHTIIMKFGRLLTMIVHYKVQSLLECCKSTGPDMGPSTI